MKKIDILVFLCVLPPMLASGCSMCGEEPLPESKPVEGSSRLPWEEIELGMKAGEFRKALAHMADLSSPDGGAEVVDCRDQSAIEVIDLAKGVVVERKAGGGALSNCALMQAGRKKSWSLLSAKGEFLGDSLVSVALVFKADFGGGLAKEISDRFGPGEERKIEERTLLGDREVTMRLWRIGEELWALEAGEKTTRLVLQDTARLKDLEDLPPPPEKGKPVNLDDIGLGGGLDLDDELDDIPQLDLEPSPDAGPGGS